jgi:hypothetical protein
MLDKISDLQRSILQSALAREDRLLPLPSNLKGATAKWIAEKLIHANWAKEVKAQKDVPVWRRDTAAGRMFALKLTAAGMKAIAAASDGRGALATAAPKITIAQQAGVKRAGARRKATNSVEAQPSKSHDPFSDRPKDHGSAIAREPRAGSKLASVLGLLCSESGATLAELVAATGWVAAFRPRCANEPAQARLCIDPHAWRARRRVDLPSRRPGRRGEAVIFIQPGSTHASKEGAGRGAPGGRGPESALVAGYANNMQAGRFANAETAHTIHQRRNRRCFRIEGPRTIGASANARQRHPPRGMAAPLRIGAAQGQP